ncbi:MAG: glycosyltransferase family protein [Nitrosomonadales bacterium]|nr:glycosyltransferase family protein [Nitrosomonadales bacterium]
MQSSHKPLPEQQRTEAEALFFAGNRHMEAGETIRAGACFSKAVQIAPDFAEAYANWGLLLDRRGDKKTAEVCYRLSIKFNQAYAEVHLNLGALLANEKRFDESEAAYKQAIALDKNSPVAWSNLGVLYACMKREEEAEQCYRMAMSMDASYATVRFNFSYLLLRQGRFEEGWECLEARNFYAPLAAHFVCPRWQGDALNGKSILIAYEVGHGDMIQFFRYAKVLKAQGAASVSMICHPALKTLFSVQEDVDTVISFDETIPTSGWDFWTPPLSIPYHCGTRLDCIPASLPYLHAAPERIAKWAALLPEHELRVGLVWKGNPLHENDADRSLPSLSVLAPLWGVKGVRFISLQKGAGEDEAARSELPLIDLGRRPEDFSDTAAIVTNLDLVICVDTAIAHLAGALGKRCWVLLPAYKADWRWLADRTDSPWYPEIMRLFRQAEMGDWAAVVAEVIVALEQWAVEMHAQRSGAILPDFGMVSCVHPS